MSEIVGGTAYICMGEQQKMVYNNCPHLAHMADVLQVTQAVLTDDPLGSVTKMQFGSWTFHFSSTDYYLFIVGSNDPDRIPFLSTQVAALRHVILLVLGPKPQLGK